LNFFSILDNFQLPPNYTQIPTQQISTQQIQQQQQPQYAIPTGAQQPAPLYQTQITSHQPVVRFEIFFFQNI